VLHSERHLLESEVDVHEDVGDHLPVAPAAVQHALVGRAHRIDLADDFQRPGSNSSPVAMP